MCFFKVTTSTEYRIASLDLGPKVAIPACSLEIALQAARSGSLVYEPLWVARKAISNGQAGMATLGPKSFQTQVNETL